MKSIREIGRFSAKSDSGQVYVIIEHQEYNQVRTLKVDTELPSLKSWVTSTGLFVNQIDAETFQIVQTDEIVRKV